MKIAIISEYPIALRGGVSVLIEVLISELSKRHKMIFVSPDTPEEISQSKILPFLEKHITWKFPKPSRANAKFLTKAIAGSGAEIAHFHFGGNFGWGTRQMGTSPIPYLAQCGIQVYTTVHSVGGALEGFCGPQRALITKLALFPFALAGKLSTLANVVREIAVSRHDQLLLQRLYAPFSHKIIQFYHSKIHDYELQRQPRNDTPVILNVGHVARKKGQHVLVEAFCKIAYKHPGWKVLLAGDVLDPEIALEIKTMAIEHHMEDRVLLLGPRTDTTALMRECSVYVQPSILEALGLALQEAMATGCACIGTRTGGIPELISHQKTGLLVSINNVDELASALDTLIINPELRSEFGLRASSAIKDNGMTVESMVDNYLRLYEKSNEAILPK